MNFRNIAACRWIIAGDLLAISRQRRGFLMPALVIGLAQVVGMSYVALHGTPVLLSTGVAALSLLLAAALSLESVIRSDVRDGTLQQLLLAAQPRSVIVLAKGFAHWLLSGVPCIALTWLCGWAMRMPASQLIELLGLLLVITPAISSGAVLIGLRSTVRYMAQPSTKALLDRDHHQSPTAAARNLLAVSASRTP
jgi:heme exporter protein B